MDEIHEELKQPLPAEEDLEDMSEGSQVTRKPQQRRSSNASIDSSQSDDFYETCDSGLSSDRCSTDVNGEEHPASKDQMLEQSRTTSEGKTYTRLRKASDRDSGAGDSVASSGKVDTGYGNVFKRSASSPKGKDAGDGLHGQEVQMRNTASPRLRRVSEGPDKAQPQGKSQFTTKAAIGAIGIMPLSAFFIFS